MSDPVTREVRGGVLEFRPASHRYYFIPEAGKKVALTAVTSILGVLDKPALVAWANKLGLQGIDSRDARDTAATRGTSIHDALEALCRDGTVPDLASFPESDRGYVKALASWWLEARPEVVSSEVMVCHVDEAFAGRFDLLARVDGRLTLLDLKTGDKPTIYTENPLQLAGYRLALRWMGEPDPEVFAVLKVCPDGSYRFQELEADPADFQVVLAAFRVVRRTKKALAAMAKAA